MDGYLTISFIIPFLRPDLRIGSFHLLWESSCQAMVTFGGQGMTNPNYLYANPNPRKHNKHHALPNIVEGDPGNILQDSTI
jgi:hypothetical protein